MSPGCFTFKNNRGHEPVQHGSSRISKVVQGAATVVTRGTDKSPLGQKPTRTKAHWTISHWTKAHCLIWQGGQKPTSLNKSRFKSFIKLLTLIRLLLPGKSHLQCVSLTLLFLLYVVTINLIWVLKAIDIWRKSIHSLGHTIYYSWETYV